MRNLRDTIVAILIIMSGPSNARLPADEETRATIVRKWKEHEDTYRAVKCTWTEKRFYMPGAIVAPNTIPGSDPGTFIPAWPEVPLEVEVEREIILLGDWMKHLDAAIGPPSEPGAAYRLSRHESTFDGERNQSISARGNTGTLVTHEEKQNIDAFSMTWWPLQKFVRPLGFASRQIDPGKFILNRLDSSTIVLNKASTGMEIQIDESRDYHIVRSSYRDPRSGNLLRDFELQVEESDGKWLPKTWTLTTWSSTEPQEIESRTVAEVTDFQFGVDLNRNDFSLSLPARVVAFDKTTGLIGPPSRIINPQAESRGVRNKIWLLTAGCLGVIGTLMAARHVFDGKNRRA